MANALKKNSYYIDSIGTVAVDAMKPLIFAIMVTPSAGDSRVTIKESVSGTVVIDIKIVANESRFISFESFMGIELRSSFEVSELTNISSVVLYGSFNAPTNAARGSVNSP